MDMITNDTTAADTGQGGFFAIDARTWARVCALGLNPAVAYLVLARGSGPDNRTSAWSVNAIENTGPLAWARKGRTEAAPRGGGHRAASGRQLPAARPQTSGRSAGALVPLVSSDDAAFVASIQQGHQVQRSTRGRQRDEYARAERLVRSGVLQQRGEAYDVAPPLPAEPELIWLPNGIIDGVGSGTAPVARLRQAQDAMLLRLFVDFYNGQHLAEHGGVSRQFTYQNFSATARGSRSVWIWGFGLDSVVVNWNGFTRCHQREVTTEEQRQGHNEGIDFFRHLESLDALHLADWVPHLVESDAPEAMAIHPYGLGRARASRIGSARPRTWREWRCYP